ncbi:MAG: hypothetical protein U9R75_03735 [Candidatus Thermoplasmatota archaeon]|nr:hypothetical protein [Candidatus Thermoplasmatota archaeon]
MDIDVDSVRFITETSVTIRGTRRRTTVPKDIADKLHLKNGSRVRWFLFKDGSIVIRKVTE